MRASDVVTFGECQFCPCDVNKLDVIMSTER